MKYDLRFRGITGMGSRKTKNGRTYDTLKTYALTHGGRFMETELGVILVSFTTPEKLAAFVNDAAEICQKYQLTETAD